MSRSAVSFVLAVILVSVGGYFGGVWPFDLLRGERAEVAVVDTLRGVADPDPVGAIPLPEAVDGVRVLYDERWLVTEGQWYLGPIETYHSGPVNPSFTTLLESDGPHGVVITVPGFYGLYRTKVELSDQVPQVATWCEDAAEASFRMVADGEGFRMASFDTSSDRYALPPGWYRVRYCTELQDFAAGQEEFTDDEYTTYAGRHLIQLWAAPRSEDRVLLQGSRWARGLASGD